jgi:hypothetical protein
MTETFIVALQFARRSGLRCVLGSEKQEIGRVGRFATGAKVFKSIITLT